MKYKDSKGHLTEEGKELAYKMFMNYSTLTEISKALDIAKPSVKYWVSKWEPERKLAELEVFAEVASNKKKNFLEITNNTVKIMTKALSHLASRETPPSMQEAARAGEILAQIDKITRLDNREPTEITEGGEKIITVRDLSKRVAIDPFYEPEAVEYKGNDNSEEDMED